MSLRHLTNNPSPQDGSLSDFREILPTALCTTKVYLHDDVRLRDDTAVDLGNGHGSGRGNLPEP